MKENSKPEAKVPKVIIFYELLFGFFELISFLGIVLLGKRLLDIYNYLVNIELIEDPNDLTVRITEKIIPNLFDHRVYIALLLLAFGVIKITSGVGLLYKKVWAEYLLVIFLVMLIPFEGIALIKHFSIADLIYLAGDIVIVAYLVKFRPIEYFQKLVKDFRVK